MAVVETKGFELLTEKEREDFKKLLYEYAEKIETRIKNVEFFRFHLKEHTKGGRAAKFSLHALVNFSGGKGIEADVVDWDLKRAVHKLFNKIETEIEHKFRVSEQNKKENAHVWKLKFAKKG